MSQASTSVSSSDILSASILVVDDQKPNITLLEWNLRAAGYVSITSTLDPSVVCQLHRENRYDLIMLDVLMPVMDGFQVMEALKEIDPDGNLPVLMISADPNHKARALEVGAKDFVSKPYELAEIPKRVYRLLEIRLLYLETKKLYDRLAAEQRVSEGL